MNSKYQKVLRRFSVLLLSVTTKSACFVSYNYIQSRNKELVIKERDNKGGWVNNRL